MGGKIISGIICLMAIIGTIIVFVHNHTPGVSVGDCLAAATTEGVHQTISCTDPGAGYRVLAQTSDSQGASCPAATDYVVERYHDGENDYTYWCASAMNDAVSNS